MKTKLIIVSAILAAALTTLSLFAFSAPSKPDNNNNYEDMWKKVTENLTKDLPETAEKELDAIEKQAEKDKNQVQLLKTILYRQQIMRYTVEDDPQQAFIRYAEVLLIKAEALVQLGRNAEAAEPFNQLRKRAGIETVAAPTFEQIKREWDYEFTYEQKSLLNSLRWKDLIASVQQVKNYKHFDDSYATSGATGKDGNEVSSFFAKIHKHLVAKYNNVKGRHYRQPIPTGLTGEDLHLEQNPGY